MFKRTKARTATDGIVARREMDNADKAIKQADKALAELDKALGLGEFQADVLQGYCGQRFALTDARLAREGC